MYAKASHKIGLLFLVLAILAASLNVNVTPARALSVPTLVAPADGEITTAANYPPLGIPEFEWNVVAGATMYRIQVSTDVGFTNIIVNETTPNTTYTPIDASDFADTKFFWRVRVESPAPAGSYSLTRNFKKEWATGNAPSLIAPANAATVDFYDAPSFSWSPVTGAAKYTLQIYASQGGWGTLTDSYVTLSTTHQPKTKLQNGAYYWRVVPMDAFSRNGTPSAERSFTAGYNFTPTLLEPANSSITTFTPTFRWTAVRGAQYYILEYTTDQTFSSGVIQENTRNTSFTPIATMSNDVNYYWRVQAVSGSSQSAFSTAWMFQKKWDIKPILLTPTNGFQHGRFPFFSWTPVPGASRYFIELNHNVNFTPLTLIDKGFSDNTFYSPKDYDNAINDFYWRVTPYDGSDKAGPTSEVSYYRGYSTSLAPHQTYPLYYYPPDTYEGHPSITTNPHEDRTVPYPIFNWHRVLLPAGDSNQGDEYAEAYRLVVSTSSIFISTAWTVDTENTYAAPSAAHPFDPLPNTDYYWRVCALVSGSCPIDGTSTVWSQVWRTRFDPSLGLSATNPAAAPTLLRPSNGFELIESTPLLEWFPVSGATSYDVEIARDEAFAYIADSATVENPAYAPTDALARRKLGNLNFGVYFWRVRVSPAGTWSAPRRFQVAAQSQWQFSRTIGNAANRLHIGSDPSGDLSDNDYDVTALYAAQDISYWYFGFDVPTAPTKNVTYALYIDTNHVTNSGATSDPHGYNISTIAGFRPEYVFYIEQEGAPGYFASDRVFVYKWNGSSWNSPTLFDQVGGSLNFDSVNGHLELKIPNTIIGYQDTTGSFAVSLISLEYCLSIPCTGLEPQDSVPADPNAPGGTVISRFSNVSERLNLVTPFHTDGGTDPTKLPSVPAFLWDWPIISPYGGANMKVYTDPNFTSEIATYTLSSSTPYWALTYHAWGDDLNGDNTYYWRVQPRYKIGNDFFLGAWSQGISFKREGFVAKNLQTSVTFSTPTFSWDSVEGAEAYQLQVSTNDTFSSTEINTTTRETSYTDDVTLPEGTYFWRVRVHRNNGVSNAWSATKTFTLTLPTPSGLAPADGTIVSRAPTLSWTPLIANNGPDPVFAAWKYRVEISSDSSFSPSSIVERTDTEQSSWTPIDGYADGTYYWHVAILDGSSKVSKYGPAQTFIKQYPQTTLTSPANGAQLDGTPTFVWEPVNGAARYKLDVSLVNTFTSLEDSVTTNNTRYTPTDKYPDGITYYWRVAIYDLNGNLGPYTGATVIINPEGPYVVSSKRVNSNPTDRANVQFTVTFSENVTGVNLADFALTKTGAIAGHALSLVSGSGKTYTVTVKTGSGDGTLRLNVNNDGTIKNSQNVPLGSAFNSGETYTVDKTFIAKSIAAQDGYILETGENTTVGGAKNSTATTLRFGDDTAKKQYRSILSFNTAALPDNAVITKITLKLKKQSVTGGGNPISTFQGFMTDIKKGFFGTSSLQPTDFAASAPKTVGPSTPALAGSWYSIDLTAAKTYINKSTTNSGLTQIRLRFKLGDNDNSAANYLSLFSGNGGSANAPQLIIVYYVP